MKTTFKTTQGFTLIETLVAITILMISVVGPLTIASKGVTAAAVSKDQVVASYLAQDAMEYLKNMRDDALLADSTNGWSNFLTSSSYLGFGGYNCGSGSTCGIETSPTSGGLYSQGNLVPCNVMSHCNLYTDSTYGFYTHNTGSNNLPTKFNRTFLITQEAFAGFPNAATLTVTVSWKNGTVLDQVVLNSMLFNTLR